MNLWLITRENGGYDENRGHVVAAEKAIDARRLAAAAAADEGDGVWLDEQCSTIVCIGKALDGVTGVQLTDYLAG